MFRLAEKLRDAGAGLVQLRDKISSRPVLKEETGVLAGIFSGSETLFILNDHPDIALDCGCDGVHLGQSDMPAGEARRLMGAETLVGISCSSVKEVCAAQSAGADYLGVGPVFPTATKECAVYGGTAAAAALAPFIKVPFFCIGGICAANLPELLRAGASRAAVCSALITAADPGAEVKRFKSILRKGPS